MPHQQNSHEGGLRTRGMFLKKSGRKSPLVSVITVVRNGERTLEQTIKSVLNQTYDNIEYLIIDGGSADGTIDIIRKYDDRIDYWKSEPDAGIYDAMNKGIAASTGELINLLNADDYLEPNALELVVSKYLEVKRPVIVYGHAFAVDDRYAVKAPMLSSNAFWLGMTINHQSMFVHREIYNAIGLYNTNYSFAADYDFLMRCFRNRVGFRLVNKCIVYYRNSGISFTSTGHRSESNIINGKYFGKYSIKRMSFIAYNFIWMPLKISLRTLMYNILGVEATRTIISRYKKLTFHNN